MLHFNQHARLKNPWWIFLVTTFGLALSAIDGGIVNVALPTLSAEFHATLSSLQWVISSYLLVTCALLPLSGRISDIYTHRLMYLLGMIIFTISSMLCGLSNHLATLITFRSFQGIGAALLFANNQALLMASFPKEKQAQAIGINSMIYASASLIGPTLGGLLMSVFSWRSIFYVNVPIGIFGIIMSLYVLPLEGKKVGERVDYISALLFAAGIFLFLFAVNHSADWSWLSIKMVTYFFLSMMAFFVLYVRQTKALQPLINMTLFKNKLFLLGNITSFFTVIITNAYFILLPFYLQNILHVSPLSIGLYLFIPGTFVALTTPISGMLAGHFQTKTLMLIGLSILAFGVTLLFTYNQHIKVLWLIFTQAMLGAGYGIFQAPNNYSTLEKIPPDQMGMGASLASLTRNMAKIVGISMAVAIFDSIQQTYLKRFSIITPHIYTTSFLIAFKAVALLSLAIAIINITIAKMKLPDGE